MIEYRLEAVDCVVSERRRRSVLIEPSGGGGNPDLVLFALSLMRILDKMGEGSHSVHKTAL